MAHRQNDNGIRFARLGAFVHSHLDDLGLDVYQFRVYSHLLRRADAKSDCNPSIRSIAEVCRICERKVQEVLCQLVQLGLIKRQPQLSRFGGPTSDLITVLGIAPPGAPHAPPLVQDMHHPGAPHAYKGNPIEGSPIHTGDFTPKKAKTPSSSDLLRSPTLPEEIDLGDSFTAGTKAQAWSLTRSYYQKHNFGRTLQAITKCVGIFAAAIQAKASFAPVLQAYLERLASLSPEDLESAIRLAHVYPLDTTPWDLVKRLNESTHQPAQPRLASESPVIQRRNERSAQATATDGPEEVQTVLAVTPKDLTCLGERHA